MNWFLYVTVKDISVIHVHVYVNVTADGTWEYRSFATYRTRFSQVFSYIIQLRRKDSRESCVTL